MGGRVCLEGTSPESNRMLGELQTVKTRAFEAEIARLKGGALKKSLHIQWFHVRNRFSPKGVKMIGVFCHTMRNMDSIHPRKYIAGFQILPNEIPGFAPFVCNEVKISMRVSAYLEREIREGRGGASSPEYYNRPSRERTSAFGPYGAILLDIVSCSTIIGSKGNEGHSKFQYLEKNFIMV